MPESDFNKVTLHKFSQIPLKVFAKTVNNF